ncbi:hypothetical protein [Halolamina salina]|uniref:Uncharacterized protein n=1 Tax=Halolamina salina TaxID=1220023 RepID=A0ABD6B836_9EURY
MTEALGPKAGEVGIPVDAICIGCSSSGRDRKTTKRVTLDELDAEDPDEIKTGTFRHVCHECQTATFWNVVDVRHDLLDDDRGGSV